MAATILEAQFLLPDVRIGTFKGIKLASGAMGLDPKQLRATGGSIGPGTIP